MSFGGSWSSPVDLSSLLGSHTDAQVAVDANGNAVAIWQRNSQTIQSSVLPFGGIWSAPVDVSPLGGDSINGRVAVDGEGNAVAVWLFLDTDYSIQSSFLPFGGSWTTPIDIAPAASNSTLSVAANEAGDIVATWREGISPDSGIQDSTTVFGGTWSAPTNISTPGLEGDEPDAGIDDCGNPVVIWKSLISRFERFIQVSSGKNVLDPQPPTNLIGGWRTNRFVDQKEYINVLKWKAGENACIDLSGYRVYVDGVFIGFVPADAPLFFEVRRRKKNRVYVYSVTVIDADGLESNPVSIALKGGK